MSDSKESDNKENIPTVMSSKGQQQRKPDNLIMTSYISSIRNDRIIEESISIESRHESEDKKKSDK